VIAGGKLPPRSFDNHVPHDSFDSSGFLKQSAWYAVDQGMAPSDLSFEEDFGDISGKVGFHFFPVVKFEAGSPTSPSSYH